MRAKEFQNILVIEPDGARQALVLMGLLDVYPDCPADCVTSLTDAEAWMMNDDALSESGDQGSRMGTVVIGAMTVDEQGAVMQWQGVAGVVGLEDVAHPCSSLSLNTRTRLRDVLGWEHRQPTRSTMSQALLADTAIVQTSDASLLPAAEPSGPFPSENNANLDMVEQIQAFVPKQRKRSGNRPGLLFIALKVSDPLVHDQIMATSVVERETDGVHLACEGVHAIAWQDASLAAVMAVARGIRKAIVSQREYCGGALGIGVVTDHAFTHASEVWERACRAATFARERSSDQIATWEMVQFHEDAQRSDINGRHLDDRLDRAIGAWSGEFGPTKGNHLTIHAQFVSRMAVRLGRTLGLSEQDLERLRVAGLCHDIGKLLIPESVLAKPGRLDRDEIALLARHAEDGACMAQLLGVDQCVVEMIRHHHTRYDCGGTAIPFGAQILSVADALVTMTSHRPYMAARNFEDAVAELERGRGRQFSPAVVDALPDAFLVDMPFATIV
ncbi:MAG: HD-GYP domain-containing protein [Phycisphaerae bacterium]